MHMQAHIVNSYNILMETFVRVFELKTEERRFLKVLKDYLGAKTDF